MSKPAVQSAVRSALRLGDRSMPLRPLLPFSSKLHTPARLYATLNKKTPAQAARPARHNTSSAQTFSRVSKSPSSLNALSQKVRQHLTSHPASPPPTTAAARDEEVWAVDQLLSLLLHPAKHAAPNTTDARSAATVSAASAAAHSLHPLLCVRVLQRLGYAVCEAPRPDPSSVTASYPIEESARRGWTIRHTYPALSSGAVPTPARILLASTISRPSQALASVTSAVLSPLLPLLGDGTAARPAHTQVLPVVPQIVEWLCTLPTFEDALPVQTWLPWVVAHYELANTKARENKNASAAATVLQLPALYNVLPHLIRKLSLHLSSAHAPKNPSDVSRLCEEQLAALFCHCRAAGHPMESEDLALGDVLWWDGEVPLLHLPGVRRALHRAIAMEFSASVEGMRADSTGNTPSTLSASGASSLPVAEAVHVTSLPSTAPVLTLRVSDDDVYRRVLLRLTALQNILIDAQQSEVTRRNNPDDSDDALVFLSWALDASLTRQSGAAPPHLADEDGADFILRFIQPLLEYVLLLQDSAPQWSTLPPPPFPETGTTAMTSPPRCATSVSQAPVRLSFGALLRVLTPTFDRLEALKRQSRCRYAAATNRAQRAPDTNAAAPAAFTLLPQKARLHELKRLCEALLHHVRRVGAAREVTQKATHQSVANNTVRPSGAEVEAPWFVDVELRQQEAVLRRFCGAARALVRVVMEERRCSLLEEGPEGSVLTASSITAARRSRTAEGGAMVMTYSEGGAELATSTNLGMDGTGSATSPSVESVRSASPPPAQAVASLNSGAAAFEHTLRTLAFRVVEPALWRLYDCCAQWHTAPPLHVLTWETWMTCLNAMQDKRAEEKGCNSAASSYVRRDVVNDDPAELLHPYLTIMEAVRHLSDSVGGRSGLRTAQQVLPHPGQQSISALVEGIRLAALRCFLFDRDCPSSTRIPNTIAVGGQEDGDVEAYDEWVLVHTSEAFFSVWQRTAPSSTSCNAADAAAMETVAEGQRRLRTRLGLLTLALHVHVLVAQQNRRAATAGKDAFSAMRVVGTAALPSSLLSLLHCLTAATSHGAPTRWAGEELSEWPLVIQNTAVLQACILPPAGTPSGCASVWELAEELGDLAANAAQLEDGRGGSAAWRWLGSPEALWDAVESDSAASSALFLLPWTTVAQSYQPLRVYDESGQTQRASQEWEATLRSWLTNSRDDRRDGSTVAGEEVGEACGNASRRPVVRLVSIAEEVQFFSALQQQPSLCLSSDVRVVCEEVRAEAEVVVPAVQRLLDTARTRQEQRTMSPAASEDKGWYAEDDYDGLD